ncbi:GNAT family N-acetyltransferase [Streptomyces sp. NPDC090303]|uniref:GNAT family N-acetyltransferase n=1 Tax=Streptomyces sp. NPDC090303 TaxID=3365960 RepID=UPI00380B4D9C
MTEWTVLSGLSVRLEPMAMRHVKGLAEAARSGASPFTPVPRGRAETRAYVARAGAERRVRASLAFTVIDRRRGIVGATRFKGLERRAPDATAGGPDSVEIGNSWLCASARGTDVNLEAKLLMLEHAFESWRAHRVCFRVDTRNHRSRAALEKLGAVCEGEWPAPSLASDGTLREVASYRVLSGEWPAVRDTITLRLSQHPRLRAGLPAGGTTEVPAGAATRTATLRGLAAGR